MMGLFVIIIIVVIIMIIADFWNRDNEPPAGSTAEETRDFHIRREAIVKSKKEAEDRAKTADEIVSRQAYFAKLGTGHTISGRRVQRCFLGTHDWATYKSFGWSTLHDCNRTTSFQKCIKCGLEQILIIGFTKSKWFDTEDGTIAHSILRNEQGNGNAKV